MIDIKKEIEDFSGRQLKPNNTLVFKDSQPFGQPSNLR